MAVCYLEISFRILSTNWNWLTLRSKNELFTNSFSTLLCRKVYCKTLALNWERKVVMASGREKTDTNCQERNVLAAPKRASGFQGWGSGFETPVVLTYLVTLVPLIGGTPRRLREDVWLRMLTVPELFLCLPQQLGGLHHVLFILMFIKPSSHQTSKVPVLVP